MLEILRQAGLAFVATLGFAILFNVPRQSLLACGVTGLMGYVARSLALSLGLAPAAAALSGAALVALLSEIFAYRFRLPATVFIVTGFIPLVPGVAATRAMIQLISGDYARGWQNATSAALTAGAIAAGIGGLGAGARALRLRRASPGRN
jgi:uncharacterized membrane protein YjjB (DUF3815 family)